MVKKWKVTIPKLSGEMERTVYLYLPESYKKEKDRRYPVMYMFDGHNVFFDEDATYGKSWGMKEYMDESGTNHILKKVIGLHEELIGLPWKSYDHVYSEEDLRALRHLGTFPDVLDLSCKCCSIITSAHFAEDCVASRLQRYMVVGEELGS